MRRSRRLLVRLSIQLGLQPWVVVVSLMLFVVRCLLLRPRRYPGVDVDDDVDVGDDRSCQGSTE